MKPLRIRSIVAATDMTPALVPVLGSAAELARLTDAHLHIVHATEHGIAEASLTAHLRAAGIEPGKDAETRILTGHPGALIVQEAARVEADVIVLGPHRPGRSTLGSTAHRVVRGAQVPCLMLPIPLPLPLACVLVPLDISEPARGALAVALTWVSALRRPRAHGGTATRLLALHVTDVGTRTTDQRTLARLQSDVAGVRERLGDVAGVSIEHAIEHAVAPANAILERAERDRCDLIVIGTRGQKPQGEFLGSVSLEMVTRSFRPVLLVPPGVWRNAQ